MLNVKTLCGDNEREHCSLSYGFLYFLFCFFLMSFFFSNHLAFKILNIFPTLKISLSFTYMC